MSTSDPERRLNDIGRAVRDAATIVAGGRRAFDDDPIAQRAAKNLIAEMGEAAKALPTEVTDAIPDVPWPQVARSRDFAVHHYGDIDLDTLWTTLEANLPPVGDAIDRYLTATFE
jgi:uncharacterized protein with HEPN domain